MEEKQWAILLASSEEKLIALKEMLGSVQRGSKEEIALLAKIENAKNSVVYFKTKIEKVNN